MRHFSDFRRPLTEQEALDEALRSEYVMKLRQLAKLGVFDEDRLQVLIRAFGKGDTSELTLTEKDTIVRAFESLMHYVLDNKQVYQKVKSSFHKEELLDESFRHPEKDELGFNTGDHEDDAHDALAKHGYERVSDGRYKHKTSGKEVVIATKNHRIAYSGISEDIDTGEPKLQKVFPPLLTFRRKAIRTFPDGKKVAMYYSDKTKKYISIPSTGDAVTEEVVTLKEGNGKKVPADSNGGTATSVINSLKGIVANREPGHVYFRNGSKMKVDMLTAHALLTTYDRLQHPENKVHFDRKLNRDNPSFLKMVEFAHKHYIQDAGAPQMPSTPPKK